MRLFQGMFSGLVMALVAAGCSSLESGNPASSETGQNPRAIAPAALLEPAAIPTAEPIAAVASETSDRAIAPDPSALSSSSQASPAAEMPDLMEQAPSAALALEQVSVGGVRLGETEVAVRQALGQPTRQTDEDWRCCGMVHTLEYGSDTTVKLLEITAGQFEVFSFSTRNPNLATPDGLRIGDSRQALLAAYGPPAGVHEENGATMIFYGAPIDYAAALWFRLEGDRIVELGYDAQLT